MFHKNGWIIYRLIVINCPNYVHSMGNFISNIFSLNWITFFTDSRKNDRRLIIPLRIVGYRNIWTFVWFIDLPRNSILNICYPLNFPCKSRAFHRKSFLWNTLLTIISNNAFFSGDSVDGCREQRCARWRATRPTVSWWLACHVPKWP